LRILGLIWKHLCKFWGPCENPLTGVDSHKWESKVEIFKAYRTSVSIPEVKDRCREQSGLSSN